MNLDRTRVGIKDVVYICIFIGSAAVSWGVVVKGNEERDKKLAAMEVRVDKNEAALNNLIQEVTKVSRDTEWIRGYLNRQNQPP